MFEIRKNLDLRKIFVPPKIFLKSRFHCTALGKLFCGTDVMFDNRVSQKSYNSYSKCKLIKIDIKGAWVLFGKSL